jgi:hypothetical protein
VLIPFSGGIRTPPPTLSASLRNDQTSDTGAQRVASVLCD